MSMFVWADGTVTGSVNVAELESIQKGLKEVGKAKLADLPWPIESAEQLADLLAGGDVDHAEPDKAEVKASKSTAKAATKPEPDNAEAEAEAEAKGNVDLGSMFENDKSTKKEKS